MYVRSQVNVTHMLIYQQQRCGLGMWEYFKCSLSLFLSLPLSSLSLSFPHLLFLSHTLFPSLSLLLHLSLSLCLSLSLSLSPSPFPSPHSFDTCSVWVSRVFFSFLFSEEAELMACRVFSSCMCQMTEYRRGDGAARTHY